MRTKDISIPASVLRELTAEELCAIFELELQSSADDETDPDADEYMFELSIEDEATNPSAVIFLEV